MKFGELADHFTGVAAKELTAVEADQEASNQHELNGVAALVELFGKGGGKLQIPTRFVYLADEEETPLIDEIGTLTFYDAREKHPTRTEYRLYYPASIQTMKRARASDVVFIAKKKANSALFLVAQKESTIALQLQWLFGIERLVSSKYATRDSQSLSNDEISLTNSRILETLGIAVEPQDGQWLRQLIDRFGSSFPSTAAFSEFARDSVITMDAIKDPDGALMKWVEQEELLFRIFERHVAKSQIDDLVREGQVDIDAFMSLSLSLQNRRKARAGRSLENHLRVLFELNEVANSYNPVTENNVRPDFLMPGIAEYKDNEFPDERLTMLAVKTTCKDRWRQVLSEASRIPTKHLLTLESPISANQTDEMRAHGVQLVIPKSLHITFPEDQRDRLWSVADFINYLKTTNS